jgi:bacteriocin biosynthesis cyclodehydratase domain-containing protein
VKHDDRRDPRGPAGPGVADLEGLLAGTRGTPPTGGVLRLNPWAEGFADAAGDVVLMRPGWGRDVIVRDPEPEDRALLDTLLAGGELPAGAHARERLHALIELGIVLEREPWPRGGPGDGRHSRQLTYFDGYGDPVRAMTRLRDARVCVIGCGGLGTWALAALASLGIGAFTLVDDDVVERSNLNRQILFAAGDIGRPKVDLAAAWLRRFDPGVDVAAHRERVASAADAERMIAGADLVVLAADWPPYELGRWINAACVAAGAPFVTAGQQPPLLRIGPTYVPGAGACFACHETAMAEAFPRYPEVAAQRRRQALPDTTLGPACGVLGSLLALEAMHLLSGAPWRLATIDRALLVDMRTLQIRWEEIRRLDDCAVCG